MSDGWVLDTGLEVLINDVLAQPGCTVRRSEIGTIGDEAHQARTSAHNPQSPPPPGNPDNEVDAADFPHAPTRGLDCARLTESLRLSRDPRLHLVIFDGRQFSSYAKDGRAPFTWRPYSGDDMHRTHAHVEVNDTHHGDLSHWKVGLSMTTLDSVFKELTDPDGDGKRADHPLYWFGPGAHAEAVRAALAATAAEGKADAILAKLDALIEAVKTASVTPTDEQMRALGEQVLAGLRGKLSVDFVPQGTGE